MRVWSLMGAVDQSISQDASGGWWTAQSGMATQDGMGERASRRQLTCGQDSARIFSLAQRVKAMIPPIQLGVVARSSAVPCVPYYVPYSVQWR